MPKDYELCYLRRKESVKKKFPWAVKIVPIDSSDFVYHRLGHYTYNGWIVWRSLAAYEEWAASFHVGPEHVDVEAALRSGGKERKRRVAF